VHPSFARLPTLPW